MPDLSLVNTKGLTKPATVLIEKISNAVGTLWEPRQIRRVAQAKADAAITLAKSDIEIDDLKHRAAQRFVEEETRKQINMEIIVQKAIKDVDSNAPTEEVEEDWITNFFDKSRSVSDDEMQNLWARILSGEANAPGSFSRKTVNVVSDLDKGSAELFRTLCSFGWQFGDDLTPLIFDPDKRIYNQSGINLYSVGELDSIGLIQINTVTGFRVSGLPKRGATAYHGVPVVLTFPAEEANSLNIGTILLTPSGRQLSRIVKPTPIDGFFDFVYDVWTKESLLPSRRI